MDTGGDGTGGFAEEQAARAIAAASEMPMKEGLTIKSL
jgi:hypothetical protein